MPSNPKWLVLKVLALTTLGILIALEAPAFINNAIRASMLDKIHLGMSREEVTAILGPHGEMDGEIQVTTQKSFLQERRLRPFNLNETIITFRDNRVKDITENRVSYDGEFQSTSVSGDE